MTFKTWIFFEPWELMTRLVLLILIDGKEADHRKNRVDLDRAAFQS